MKQIVLLAAIGLLTTQVGAAQSHSATLAIPRLLPEDHTTLHFVPLHNARPFIAWSVVWRGNDEALLVRFSEDKNRWNNDWLAIRPDPHTTLDPAGRKVGHLQFEPAQMAYMQVRANAEASDVVFHFFSPGVSGASLPSSHAAQTLACPCPQPPFQKRHQWCPAGNCPPHPNPSYTTVTHLIVHHSATANTANDWAAVVRSIWNFHVNINGWADIGYNWLIDPNGVLYEGRGDDVVGAHFCGTNGGTAGICMLGDFTQQSPTTEALNQLRDLLAWKLCAINANPLGTALHTNSGIVLHRIAGHQDGCSTACPGNALYPMLPAVRQSVAQYTAQICSATSTRPDAPDYHALVLYPNPVEHILSVRVTASPGAWMSILKPDGRQMQAPQWITGQGLHEISVAHLPPGIYYLQLRYACGRQDGAPFIKQ